MRVFCTRPASGSIGAAQESVDDAAVGMIVCVERQMNLTCTL